MTGKVLKGEKPQEGRLGWSADKSLSLQSSPSWEKLDDPHNWKVLEAVESIAKAKGMLAWI